MDSKPIIYLFTLMSIILNPVQAWSNGGYSTDQNNPKYGTHDFILESAINMLPQLAQNKINITVAMFGSEIPDCTTTTTYCIGDSFKHHVYYRASGALQDDASAVRAQQEYNLSRSYLQSNDTYNFSLHLGSMSHYISDLSVFGHTMGSGTDWGAETHHSDYESYVENHLGYFNNYIFFDGLLENRTAYNATLKLAYETTFDSGTYTNTWMDDNYNWTNEDYKWRTRNLINYSINLLADILNTLINPAESDNPKPFDTGAGSYPSIMGTHNGTIRLNQNLIVGKMYTYPGAGTGGHSEYAAFFHLNGSLLAEGYWSGYTGDWRNITFTPFTLEANVTYNYMIITGSYPQIIHNNSISNSIGTIASTQFIDANGRCYTDWIPAMRLE